MRVMFFGTPAFAVPVIRSIAVQGHEFAAVITQPGKVSGRGMTKLVPSPVAVEARSMGAKVLQPANVRDPEFLAETALLHPDVIVVAAYGRILPGEVLAAAPLGAWNIHPSLLPRWRGPAPVQRAIWAGDERTGVSIMKMTEEMDAGPVALQEGTMVSPRDTHGELEEWLSIFGAAMMVEALDRIGKGDLPAVPQDNQKATYAGAFKPEETELRWPGLAAELDRLVRALNPVPGAWFRFNKQRIKVRDVQPLPYRIDEAPGTLLERIPDHAWRVACGSGSLWIGSVLPEGKSWMSMDAFVQGRRLSTGERLE